MISNSKKFWHCSEQIELLYIIILTVQQNFQRLNWISRYFSKILCSFRAYLFIVSFTKDNSELTKFGSLQKLDIKYGVKNSLRSVASPSRKYRWIEKENWERILIFVKYEIFRHPICSRHDNIERACSEIQWETSVTFNGDYTKRVQLYRTKRSLSWHASTFVIWTIMTIGENRGYW